MNPDIKRPALIVADQWHDYQLLECGDGMKQEKWGPYTLVRPDPQIIWPRHGAEPGAGWAHWDGFYHRSEAGGGNWEFRRELPDHWEIAYELGSRTGPAGPGLASAKKDKSSSPASGHNPAPQTSRESASVGSAASGRAAAARPGATAVTQLRFKIRPTSFKHTGLFPEQSVNWEWCAEKIREAVGGGNSGNSAPSTAEAGGEEPRLNVLNLFGYTGAATCAAAAAGAAVCHVDAAEGMVKWCRENAALSGLGAAPIRYIVDDCLKFVRREQKRGRRYDAVIMDPPTYGRGSAGEMWRLEDNLWELLRECRAVMSDRPLFFLINAYTARLSPTVVANLLSELFGSAGAITAGEVGLPIKRDGKVLPCGIYGRWESAGSLRAADRPA